MASSVKLHKAFIIFIIVKMKKVTEGHWEMLLIEKTHFAFKEKCMFELMKN